MSNKKAQSLSLNTIIIAILVVLVLIVVVTFFLGGFSRIKDTITNVFFPVSSGTDLTVAVQTCQQYCDQARLLPSNRIKEQSSYCKSYFGLDFDPKDGQVDIVSNEKGEKVLKKFYCYKTNKDNEGHLDIPCQVEKGELEDICNGK